VPELEVQRGADGGYQLGPRVPRDQRLTREDKGGGRDMPTGPLPSLSPRP